MPKTELKPVTGVPPEKVGEVVQAFIDNGVQQVSVTKDNGAYTVTPLA
jgi:hypothetical protein